MECYYPSKSFSWLAPQILSIFQVKQPLDRRFVVAGKCVLHPRNDCMDTNLIILSLPRCCKIQRLIFLEKIQAAHKNAIAAICFVVTLLFVDLGINSAAILQRHTLMSVSLIKT